MLYLQYFCCCVGLRTGTVVLGILELIMDIFFGLFIAIFGESGIPDLCHKLFLVFMILHIVTIILLFIGAGKLRPGYLLPYLLLSIVKILLMIILLIADALLNIWFVIMVLYVIMFFVGIYFWLVTYSFYAALGGDIFL